MSNTIWRCSKIKIDIFLTSNRFLSSQEFSRLFIARFNFMIQEQKFLPNAACQLLLGNNMK
jgi:hypothetical protein